jgi:hypothetical protein
VNLVSLTHALALIAMGAATLATAPPDAGSATAPPDAGTAASAPAAGSTAPPLPRLPAEAFALDRKPRLRQTQAWTRSRKGSAPSWESAHPGVHFSRFLDLARPSFHPPKVRDLPDRDWRINLFRFAAAMIADLREAVAAACPPGRCTPTLRETAQRLGRFVTEHPRDFTYTALPAAPGLGTWYGWQLGGGDLSFSVGCHDAPESPEVRCRLEVPLDEELRLSFAPRPGSDDGAPELSLVADEDGRRVGEVGFERTYGGAPVVILGGRALARPPAARGGGERPDKAAPPGYDDSVDHR